MTTTPTDAEVEAAAQAMSTYGTNDVRLSHLPQWALRTIARAALVAAARVRPTDEATDDPWCREEGCQYRHWSSGAMPTHRRGEGCPTLAARPADEDTRAEVTTPGWLRVDDGTTWPRPALDQDEALCPSWRATYAPDTLTRADLLYLASVASAYGRLVTTPSAAKQLPAVRRALAEFTVTRAGQPTLADAWDQGARAAGSYGHEDGWTHDVNPLLDNPYRAGQPTDDRDAGATLETEAGRHYAAFVGASIERDEARRVIAAVRALADQHADWCCSKGCTGHGMCGSRLTSWDPAKGKCDESCNCESQPYLAALDGDAATPQPTNDRDAPTLIRAYAEGYRIHDGRGADPMNLTAIARLALKNAADHLERALDGDADTPDKPCDCDGINADGSLCSADQHTDDAATLDTDADRA